MGKSRVIIAHHLILHGYGHWLPNDPRGSGSQTVKKRNLSALGPVHFGRKSIQPPRSELREFYQGAAPRLDFEPMWFDDAKRQAIGEVFSQIVTEKRYTVWACAVLRNHAHLCVRRHRDDAQVIWSTFADASQAALRQLQDIDDNHPIWSNRPYSVFLSTPDDVRRVVTYIGNNPPKEKLPRQKWSFVKLYDKWPYK